MLPASASEISPSRWINSYRSDTSRAVATFIDTKLTIITAVRVRLIFEAHRARRRAKRAPYDTRTCRRRPKQPLSRFGCVPVLTAPSNSGCTASPKNMPRPLPIRPRLTILPRAVRRAFRWVASITIRSGFRPSPARIRRRFGRTRPCDSSG